MTLAEQLDARKAKFVDMAPPERVAGAENAITKVADSGILDKAINLGDKAPDFTLPDALGNSVSLYDELAKGPVILTWYRGSWCPYCNIQLHDYQQSLSNIEAAGAQLMAVSPELSDSALTWKEKNELEFIVLSDVGNEVARGYGIVYRIPKGIEGGYVAGGRNDLTKYNGDDSLELPLAVTYVIGTDGTIEYAFVDADYRKRAETSEVVEFVKQFAAESE
ncbi:MAG: redoxin domain-containing protein [Woeseiaceae bacterium]|nr:redoxin domain-containing protein [Woeseiaceae bacterium]